MTSIFNFDDSKGVINIFLSNKKKEMMGDETWIVSSNKIDNEEQRRMSKKPKWVMCGRRSIKDRKREPLKPKSGKKR